MSEALTHPTLGYYTSGAREAAAGGAGGDVFGAKGDFVTSPEVSQVFGELLGVWCALVWEGCGRPKQVSLVELGPGRGTLMADLLRGVCGQPQLADFRAALHVHLVEVSIPLRSAQARSLGCPPPPLNPSAPGFTDSRFGQQPIPVSWHASLSTVPHGPPLLLLAHEFFDALPIHQFERSPERGWCERMLDEGDGASGSEPLRWVLSSAPTLAARMLVPLRLAAAAEREKRKAGIPVSGDTAPVSEPSVPPPPPRFMEVSPRSWAVWGEVAGRVGRSGGGALAVDYGSEGPLGPTLAAIRRHAFVEPLDCVGSADLSAHVDFGALRMAAVAPAPSLLQGQPPCPPAVRVYGPVTQRALLARLGVEQRVGALLEGCEGDEQADALIAGAERLVSEAGMGGQYRAMALVNARFPGAPPGFEGEEGEAG